MGSEVIDCESNINSNSREYGELRSDMSEIKTAVREMINNMNALTASNSYMTEKFDVSINKINETLTKITTQVIELKNKDEERSKQIKEMEIRMKQMEQKLLEKNIEINSATAVTMDAETVVKKIAASVGVNINEEHIEKAYCIKNKNKVIVEFSSSKKKKEIMDKLKSHRLDENVLDDTNNNPTNKYIFVNDELTGDNRRVLWMAKVKAKENGWKFVWVKNGRIYARKNESSSQIIINSSADIDMITSTQ